jgi:hypothetical protein
VARYAREDHSGYCEDAYRGRSEEAKGQMTNAVVISIPGTETLFVVSPALIMIVLACLLALGLIVFFTKRRSDSN